MRIGYRIQQFWLGLTAGPLTDTQRAAIRQQLSPALVELFGRFGYEDQQHSYRVWRMLIEAGETNEALLQAALLHDIGKIRLPISLLQRTVVVLGRLLPPATVKKWGARPLLEAHWWEKPFIVRRQHPLWGAEMVEQLGGGELVCNLIARHQDKCAVKGSPLPEDALLLRLQWADNQN